MDSETSKPQLPKRLAQKIYAAQSRVEAARYTIIRNDESIAQDQSRIAEYEENPVLFASRYYGDHPYDSYPIQTNISRCRERLERHVSRRKAQNEELVEAERNLKVVEIDVLNEVNTMRKGTKGRVSWPRDIRSLEELRHIENLQNQRYERQSQRRREKDLADLELEIKQLEEESRLEEEAAYLEWQEELAKMSPHEREQHRKSAKRLLAALESGEITGTQIIGVLHEKNTQPNKSLQQRSGTSCLSWTVFKSRFYGLLRKIFHKTTT